MAALEIQFIFKLSQVLQSEPLAQGQTFLKRCSGLLKIISAARASLLCLCICLWFVRIHRSGSCIPPFSSAASRIYLSASRRNWDFARMGNDKALPFLKYTAAE